MPKMVHIRDPITGRPIYVRAGSLSTKPAWQQWRAIRERVRAAPELVHWVGRAIVHADRIVWPHSGERLVDRDELEDLYTDLEWLRDEISRTMAVIDTVVPLRRRIELLENVQGRTPEEAERFRAKAAELREELAHDER